MCLKTEDVVAINVEILVSISYSDLSHWREKQSRNHDARRIDCYLLAYSMKFLLLLFTDVKQGIMARGHCELFGSVQ